MREKFKENFNFVSEGLARIGVDFSDLSSFAICASLILRLARLILDVFRLLKKRRQERARDDKDHAIERRG